MAEILFDFSNLRVSNCGFHKHFRISAILKLASALNVIDFESTLHGQNEVTEIQETKVT